MNWNNLFEDLTRPTFMVSIAAMLITAGIIWQKDTDALTQHDIKLSQIDVIESERLKLIEELSGRTDAISYRLTTIEQQFKATTDQITSIVTEAHSVSARIASDLVEIKSSMAELRTDMAWLEKNVGETPKMTHP